MILNFRCLYFYFFLNHRGKRGSLERASMRLDSTDAEGGPIYTVITELAPYTILINEVDKSTGTVVMTSSLSLVTDAVNESTITELIQISHEVGTSTQGANKVSSGKNKSAIIEGHQVWRFYPKDAYQ